MVPNVAGYLWYGMYVYLINNVGLFHLNNFVLKYFFIATFTNSPTYLDKNSLVLLSCVVCLINLKVYDRTSRYLSFLTTSVEDILCYIYCLH